MKETLIFNYESHGEIKQREIIVTNESETNILGLDIALLDEDELTKALEVFANWEPQPMGTSLEVKGFDSNWNKAFRNFRKDKISLIEE